MVARELSTSIEELMSQIDQLQGEVSQWEAQIAELQKEKKAQAAEQLKREEWPRVKGPYPRYPTNQVGDSGFGFDSVPCSKGERVQEIDPTDLEESRAVVKCLWKEIKEGRRFGADHSICEKRIAALSLELKETKGMVRSRHRL